MDSTDHTTSKGFSKVMASASMNRNLALTPAAGAEAAADVEDPGARRDSRSPRQMLDELHLRNLFRFIAANPVAMMDVFAPQRMVVGTHAIVVIADLLFVVRPRPSSHVEICTRAFLQLRIVRHLERIGGTLYWKRNLEEGRGPSKADSSCVRSAGQRDDAKKPRASLATRGVGRPWDRRAWRGGRAPRTRQGRHLSGELRLTDR